jgi:hypothetical protein
LTPGEVQAEADEILRLTAAALLPVRLIGSLAIARRCPEFEHLMAELGRRPPQDIDLVAYSRDEPALDRLLRHRGYGLHPSVRHTREWGVKRLIYVHPDHDGKVDVFLDQLVMAHTVDFRGRLETETETVAPADLLLSKLQIYRITRNDLIDLVVLLAEHEPGADPSGIVLDRVTQVLGNDWGFSYGVQRNLRTLEEQMAELPMLAPTVRERVTARVRQLETAIDAAPKGARWRLRARVGTRAPWYEHVDDVAD